MSGHAGQDINLPVLLHALGDENALGFFLTHSDRTTNADIQPPRITSPRNSQHTVAQALDDPRSRAIYQACASVSPGQPGDSLAPSWGSVTTAHSSPKNAQGEVF